MGGLTPGTGKTSQWGHHPGIHMSPSCLTIYCHGYSCTFLGGAVFVCLCVPDDFTADLCWCKQSEELGPAGLSGFQPQNCFPWKTCHRYRSFTSTEYKTVKMCFFKIGRYFKCWLFILPAPLPSSASNAEVREHKVSRKQTHIPSYQQINCVDNIIRCVAINMTFFFCSTQSLS